MDISDFIVLGLTAAVFAFLAWIEIKSRQNKKAGATVGVPLGVAHDTTQQRQTRRRA